MKPSIETAIRRARSQRSWGFATLSAAVTGAVVALISGDTAWWLIAAAFAMLGLILVSTAPGRVKMAIAMRAAHMQTVRGFQGTSETREDAGQAFAAAVTLVSQTPSWSLDTAFDSALDEILQRRGY